MAFSMPRELTRNRKEKEIVTEVKTIPTPTTSTTLTTIAETTLTTTEAPQISPGK